MHSFSWFVDGTVLTATTGRDGKTVVKMESWSRPLRSRRQFQPPLTRTVSSRRFLSSVALYRAVPSNRKCSYRSVPSTKPSRTAPSRLQHRPLPSGRCVSTCFWCCHQWSSKGTISVKWGKTMVTQGEYMSCVELGGYTPPACGPKEGSLCTSPAPRCR